MAKYIASRIINATTTVSDSATLIPATKTNGRFSLLITNKGVLDLFIGDSSVTTSTGTPIGPSEKLAMDVGQDVKVYGIVASGTADVRTLEGA